MAAIQNYASMHNVSDVSNLTVLGFENGFHGASTATLSCSDPWANRKDLATFDWPLAPFPKMKYPMCAHEAENKAEEDRCLDAIRELISS